MCKRWGGLTGNTCASRRRRWRGHTNISQGSTFKKTRREVHLRGCCDHPLSGKYIWEDHSQTNSSQGSTFAKNTGSQGSTFARKVSFLIFSISHIWNYTFAMVAETIKNSYSTCCSIFFGISFFFFSFRSYLCVAAWFRFSYHGKTVTTYDRFQTILRALREVHLRDCDRTLTSLQDIIIPLPRTRNFFFPFNSCFPNSVLLTICYPLISRKIPF